jgi:hypothetical protein
MGYEPPAIEARLVVEARLVTAISGGGGDFAQPVWRTHTPADADVTCVE